MSTPDDAITAAGQRDGPDERRPSITIDRLCGSEWDVVVSDDEARMFEYSGPVYDLADEV